MTDPQLPAPADRFVPDTYQGTLEPNYYCRHWNPRRKKYCRARAGQGTDHPGVGRCKHGGGAAPVRHGRYSLLKRAEIRELVAHHEADPDPLNLFGELAVARALLTDFLDRYEETTAALLAWHQSYTAGARPLAPAAIQALEDVLDELEAHIGPVPEEPPVRSEPEPQAHGGWLKRERVEETADEELRIHASVRAVRGMIESMRAAADLKPRRILDLGDAIGHAEAISRIVKRIEDVRAQNAISRPELMRIMQEMGRVVARYVADEETREKIQDGWLSIRAG